MNRKSMPFLRQCQLGPGLVANDLTQLACRQRVSHLMTYRVVNHTSWGAFLGGVLFGSRQALETEDDLSAQHAQAWIPLVRWAQAEFRGQFAEEARRPTVDQRIMFVLELPWPDDVRVNLYEQLADVLEECIRSAAVDAFVSLHYDLRRELKGERLKRENVTDGGRPIAPSDDLMLRLCRASAERVIAWKQARETTEDLGYIMALSGEDTAELIKCVFEHARDREHVRRNLPPIIDLLGGVGFTKSATALRLMIRQP